MLNKEQWKQVGILLLICLIGGGCLTCVSGCGPIIKALEWPVRTKGPDEPALMPEPDETQAGWLLRCMGDDAMTDEFSESQRDIACRQRWLMRPGTSNVIGEFAAGLADGLSETAQVVSDTVQTPMGGTMAGILALLAAQKGGRKTVAAVRKRRKGGSLLETKA